MTLSYWLKALVLLAAAHTAPWAAARLLGARLATPLDGGMRLCDGRRVLGDHKTWRGLLASTSTCALVAPSLGYSARLGLVFAVLAMAGDTISSLIKRRLRLSPGAEIWGLDQLPEAFAPLLALSDPLGISVLGACLLAGVFLLLDLAAMPLRHYRRLRLRTPRGASRP